MFSMGLGVKKKTGPIISKKDREKQMKEKIKQ